MTVKEFCSENIDQPVNGIVIEHEGKEYVLYEIGNGSRATGEESWMEWYFLAPIDWRTSYALQEIWDEIKDDIFEEMGLVKGHSAGIMPGATYIDHQELEFIDGMLFVRTYKAINI